MSSSAACLTYGMIANPDIPESTIPDPTFESSLQMGEKVGPYLGHTRPVRWAAIHFSERARDLYLTDLESMYQKLLVPCWQSFRALNQIRAPIGIVTDDHLAGNELAGYKILILPRPEVLTSQEQQNVDAFEAAGGVVIELANDPRWYTAGQQEQIRTELLSNVLSQAGEPPVSMTGGTQGCHAVAVKEPNDANQVVVCVTNEFMWLGYLQSHRLDGDYTNELPGTAPEPVTDAVLFVKGPEPKCAFDAVSQKRLLVVPVENGVKIILPSFDYLACVVLDYEKVPIDYFWKPLAELALAWLDDNIEIK